MKAFWWFETDKIAGMARPGFNSCRWFDLTFEEAIVVGWLGQHSSGRVALESYWQHVDTYVPKVAHFYKLDETQRQDAARRLRDPEFLEAIFKELASRTRFISEFAISEDHLQFEIHREQLATEVDYLKHQGINRIVSLTEAHHLKDGFEAHFDLDHISIVDMSAPTIEQAQVLSEILEKAEKEKSRVAVHCLAGIGRTSTMLIAAELLRGKKLQDLLEQVSKQNPYFAYVGSQAEFIRKLAAGLTK